MSEKGVLPFDGGNAGRNTNTKTGRALLVAGVATSAPVVEEDFKPGRAGNEIVWELLESYA